jgi:hypothetical protein
MSFFPFSVTTKIVRFAAVFMMPLAHKISFEAHRLGVFAILTFDNGDYIGGGNKVLAMVIFCLLNVIPNAFTAAKARHIMKTLFTRCHHSSPPLI